MRNGFSTRIGWVACAALLQTGSVVAAETTHACAVVTNDAGRLACYDAAFGKPAAAAAGLVTSTGTASAVPSVGKAGVGAGARAANDDASKVHESFGMSEASKRAREPQQPAQPTSITSTLTQVSSRPTGQLVLTLEDGQVWTQTESDLRFRARPGDAVTIRKASLGSYLMVGPDRVATRVRRIK